MGDPDLEMYERAMVKALIVDNDRLRSALSKDVVQRAILAALGCTKIDYRSPRKLDESASQIADFVIAAARDHSQGGEG